MTKFTVARRVWAVAGAAAVVIGIAFSATHVDLGTLDTELRFRSDAHGALHQLLADPAVQPGLRCGRVYVPNHKLIPDVRWILHDDAGEVLARSSLPRSGQNSKGVQVFVTGPTMLTNSTYGPFVPGSRDDARIQVPGPGLRLRSPRSRPRRIRGDHRRQGPDDRGDQARRQAR